MTTLNTPLHPNDEPSPGRPRLSAVVCSIGKAHPEATVASIQAAADAAGADVEVVVVWQAKEQPPDFGFGVRVLEVFPVGLSYARNQGLEASTHPVVAFVDDDEVVDRSWVSAILDNVAGQPGMAAMFGPVVPLDDDGIAHCRIEGDRPRTFHGLVHPWAVGTGGNMAFDRSTLLDAGGFSAVFGAGSPGRSAEDSEIILRLLRRGSTLAWVPNMVVYHPTKSHAEHLASRYPYGYGAGALARRYGDYALATRYVWDSLRYLWSGIRGAESRLCREAVATLRGFAAGLLRRSHPSPMQFLDRLPQALRGRLLGDVKALGIEGPEGLHFRWRVGRHQLLHLYADPSPEQRRANKEGKLDVWVEEEAGCLWVLEA
jgi:glycosyltransferase involved in cell wall biosynthesis